MGGQVDLDHIGFPLCHAEESFTLKTPQIPLAGDFPPVPIKNPHFSAFFRHRGRTPRTSPLAGKEGAQTRQYLPKRAGFRPWVSIPESPENADLHLDE